MVQISSPPDLVQICHEYRFTKPTCIVASSTFLAYDMAIQNARFIRYKHPSVLFMLEQQPGN